MERGFEQRSDQTPSSATERGELSPCRAQAGSNGVTYTLRVVGGCADHAVAAARVAASHPQPQLLPRHITGCVRRGGAISRLKQKRREALSCENPRGDASTLAQPEGGQAGWEGAGWMDANVLPLRLLSSGKGAFEKHPWN